MTPVLVILIVRNLIWFNLFLSVKEKRGEVGNDRKLDKKGLPQG